MEAMVQNKKSLLQRVLNHRTEIESFGVRRLGLFGSFVREKQVHLNSDVDFLVEFAPSKKTFNNFMELSFYLENLLRRKVELVTPQSLSPYIGPAILKEVEDVLR